MKNTQDSIAVTSRSFSRHPFLRKELLSQYDKVTFNDGDKALEGEELFKFLEGHSRAIVALETIDDNLLSRLPELKIISKYGVGLDRLDIDSLRNRGIRLGWTGGVNRRAVSELTLTLALMMLRRIPESYSKINSGRWTQVIGKQLTNKTIGIIGCGNIGKDLVGMLSPFECCILVNDIVNYEDFYQRNGIRPVSMDALLSASDIVTLHVPLNATTRNIISNERLLQMKRGAILLNTARGGLVDEDALANCLQQGYLSAAAFDVFTEEPVINQALLEMQNFYCTSHIGGSSEEAILAMGRAAINGLNENRIP